ncbi:MAG TPA: hypothetical protein VFA38_04610, partial [Nitrospirales bacterium]|nr:hypothetical protein [Nitrospirales bacterium]
MIPASPDFLTAERPQSLTLTLPLQADAFALYGRMTIPGRASFLLESPAAASPLARWSFVAANPYCTLRGRGRRYERRHRDGLITVH